MCRMIMEIINGVYNKSSQQGTELVCQEKIIQYQSAHMQLQPNTKTYSEYK